MNDTEKRIITGQPEYDKHFWDFMRGSVYAENHLSQGQNLDTGTYRIPSGTDNRYEKAITKESIFRSIASVYTCYGCSANIWATDCDDMAEYIDEGETIPLRDIGNDVSRIAIKSHKLAVLLRATTEMITDATFDIETFLVKRLAKNYARAEDKSFLIGNGVKEPIGILNSSGGAEVAMQTNGITYDDVIQLYFSVKPEYRKNAVWMMNDSTATALRVLKDADGNYLWNGTDNTILGKRIMISEYMPNESEGTKPIAFGDFSYYWIVKRSPITIKTLTDLYAIKGQTGYLSFEFLDGKLIRTDAIKVIQIHTDTEVGQ